MAEFEEEYFKLLICYGNMDSSVSQGGDSISVFSD